VRSPVPLWLTLALLALSACASTRVEDRERYSGERLPRPDRILVPDFAATIDDIPAWSPAKNRHAMPSQPRTDEEVATGRALGKLVADRLVEELHGMGLPAIAGGRSKPRPGDLVLLGTFESVDEGSALKRVVIGFGYGSADLQTRVEGYRMTGQGLRLLGSGEVDAAGGKTPGAVVPVIVTIATANPVGIIVGGAVKAGGELTGRTTIEGAARRTARSIADELRVAFQKQGWI
jgi:hypothetical protein